MSRFNDCYDDDETFPNSGAMWWANIERSINGRKGQQALRDLEASLLDLPEPRLISGHLAKDGEVCTVGALALRRRMTAGEARDQILAAFEERTPPMCVCYHPRHEHVDGTGECRTCELRRIERFNRGVHGERSLWMPQRCHAFDEDEGGEDGEGADETASAGVEVGLTYALSWRLAYLNDEDFRTDTPEQRYEHVLAWVRKRQKTATAPTLSVGASSPPGVPEGADDD